MKKEERFLKITGIAFVVVVIIFVGLLLRALLATVQGDRADAAFLLLWAIALDMVFTGIRNVAVERYNDKIEKEEQERAEQYERARKTKASATQEDIASLLESLGYKEFLVVINYDRDMQYYQEYGNGHWSFQQAEGHRMKLKEAAMLANDFRKKGVVSARVITTSGATTIF